MENFIDEVKARPFAWHDFDCGPGWAGRHTELMLGVDFAADYRGKYTDLAGALRIMHRAGFANLGDLVAHHLPEIHSSQARLGDLAAVAHDSPFRWSLGIVNGERILLLEARGVGTVDLLSAGRAWRVGDA